jgi:RHS repeat-associated protein
MDLSYNYDGAHDNGQIQEITDNLVPTRTARYIYDALGRVQQAQTIDQTSPNTWNLQFTYDRYGNRLTETPVGGTANMPNSQLMVDPITNRITTGGFGYDAAGNMTSDSAFNYGFDGANRITSVVQPGTTTSIATYAYDDRGLRVNKNGSLYIYSGSQVIAEYANGATAGSPSSEYIYTGGRRVATLINGAFTYHYWDHLSIRSTADASGNVVRTYGHFPFGETWYETGAANKWKFTSYEHDGESGLDDAVNRFYGSLSGRFYSPDPLSGSLDNPQSLNRYAYSFNNPVRFTDSDGQYPKDQHEFLTFWLAVAAGRDDAQDLATGAGRADSFFYSVGFSANFGLGLFVFDTYDLHFGTPPNYIRDGIDGGFDLHLVEDVYGPHMVGMPMHIVSDIVGHSVDKDPFFSQGFFAAGLALGIPPNSPAFDALETLRQYLNENHYQVGGLEVTIPATTVFVDDESVTIPAKHGCHVEGSACTGNEFINATFIGTIYADGYTIKIYKQKEPTDFGRIYVDSMIKLYQVGYSDLDKELARLGIHID